jgi:hypothetical protein
MFTFLKLPFVEVLFVFIRYVTFQIILLLQGA